MKCPSCGGAVLVSTTKDVEYIYKGKETAIQDVTAKFAPYASVLPVLA